MTTDDYAPQENRRYLRLTIGVTPRTQRVMSVALVDGVPARHLAAGHPYVVVTDIGGDVAHVSRHPSPMIQRSTRLEPDGGHHFETSSQGLIEVAVPFSSLSDLTRMRVSISEVSDRAPTEAAELARHVDDRRARGETVRELGFDHVQAAPNWPRTADALGVPVVVGTFEISVDREGRHRWRLRRADGSIAATSSRSFSSRGGCEADLLWVKENAASAPVR